MKFHHSRNHWRCKIRISINWNWSFIIAVIQWQIWNRSLHVSNLQSICWKVIWRNWNLRLASFSQGKYSTQYKFKRHQTLTRLTTFQSLYRPYLVQTFATDPNQCFSQSHTLTCLKFCGLLEQKKILCVKKQSKLWIIFTISKLPTFMKMQRGKQFSAEVIWIQI